MRSGWADDRLFSFSFFLFILCHCHVILFYILFMLNEQQKLGIRKGRNFLWSRDRSVATEGGKIAFAIS